jgi:hypothetical protein
VITVSRSLVRQLRAVFRRTLRMTSRDTGPNLLLAAGPDGLRIQARNMHAAVEHHVPGDFPVEQICLPFAFLAECEGGRAEPVVLEQERDGCVAAQWSDNRIPQVVQYDSLPPDDTPFPAVPSPLAEIDKGLWQVLAAAMETTDPALGRHVTDCVQLSGSNGRIAATDGRQLLVHTGFGFPWGDDVLVPRTSLFACKDLRPDSPLLVGRSDTWLTLQTGPWTFHLAIDTERCFPKVEQHLQQPETARVRVELASEDADFLADALRRLPCDEDNDDHPVTIDLNGQVIVRAATHDSKAPTELVLSRSSTSGENLRLAVNCTYLARTLKLGLRQLFVFGAELPMQASNGNRTYVWAPLGKTGIVKPSRKAVRIDSADAPAEPCESETPPPSATRSKTAMTKSTKPPIQTTVDETDSVNGNGNGHVNGNGNGQPDTVGSPDPIELAEALRTTLRTAATQTAELISALRQQKKANKNVQTVLASLRQLQGLAG